MPTEILKQLKTLREGIAEALKKDPRYLTLNALDKSIAEISAVLSASGLIASESAAAPAPLQFTPPAATPAGTAPLPAPQAPQASPASTGAATKPAVVEKPRKKSIIKPLIETAAVLAVGGLAAEAYSEMKAKPAKAAAKSDAKTEDEGESDEEPAPAKSHDEGEDHDKDKDHDKEEDSEESDAEAGESADVDGEHAEADHEAAEAHAEDSNEDPAGVVPDGKASGYKAMAAKPDAPQYQPSISVKYGKLPNKVDLRSLMTPIEDQGETSSCVANAVAGAYEYWIKKASKQDTNISRLFVYYNARWRDGSQDKDEGSVIQLAMEGLSKFGACSEKVWPFDKHLILKKPGAQAYQDAAAYRVHDMAQVPLKLEAWKQALAEGKPIVFGCELFDSFDECSKRGGVVPLPAPDDIARKKHSGHSMCAVGYSDSENVFIVRNSWGAEWGDKGYCYMPYSYLMNSKFNDGDCWVFVPKVPMQPPREVWSDTTTPVTNSGQGVDFAIETYSIADYERVAVDLFKKVRHPFNSTIVSGYSTYVSAVSRGIWSELEHFDFVTYLASAAALTGVASIAAESYLSETSSSTTTTSETSTSLMSTEENKDDDDPDGDEDEPEDDEDDPDGDDDEPDDEPEDDDDDPDGDEDEPEDDDDDPDGDDDEPEDDEDGAGDDDEEPEDDEDGAGDDDEEPEDNDDGAGDDDDEPEDDEDGAGDDDDEPEDDEDGAGDDDEEPEDDDDGAGDDDDDAGDDDDNAGDDDSDGGDDDGGGDDGGDDD